MKGKCRAKRKQSFRLGYAEPPLVFAQANIRKGECSGKRNQSFFRKSTACFFLFPCRFSEKRYKAFADYLRSVAVISVRKAVIFILGICRDCTIFAAEKENSSNEETEPNLPGTQMERHFPRSPDRMCDASFGVGRITGHLRSNAKLFTGRSGRYGYPQ